MLQNIALHSRFVDERTVRTSEVLKQIPFSRFDKFRVVPRHMLIVQHNVSIALAAYQNFRGYEREDILLSVGS